MSEERPPLGSLPIGEQLRRSHGRGLFFILLLGVPWLVWASGTGAWRLASAMDVGIASHFFQKLLMY